MEQSLNSTVLIRDPDTKNLHVNYDPQIHELMREIDVMRQMGIQVPVKAQQMREMKNELKIKFNDLKVRMQLF